MQRYDVYSANIEKCDNGDWILYRDYLEEKSGNLPEANRNAVLADVRVLLNIIDEEKSNFLNGKSENMLRIIKQADKVAGIFTISEV